MFLNKAFCLCALLLPALALAQEEKKSDAVRDLLQAAGVTETVNAPFASKDPDLSKLGSRVVPKEDMSPWMRATGRLLTLGKRCSLVLVRSPNAKEAHFALSSKHCIEKALVVPNDHTRNETHDWQFLKGRFLSNKKGFVDRELSVNKHSGDAVGGDWVILMLNKAVALSEVYSFEIEETPPYQLSTEIAVGYSATKRLPGAYQGRLISYDDSCAFEMLLKATGGDVVRVVDCQMSTGASGGAYVGFDKASKQPVLMGVLKAEHKDRVGVGYYVHLSTLMPWLKDALSTVAVI